VVASTPPDPIWIGRGRRFNPLHCGAVVASRFRRGTLSLFARCFNPLHCGAVVASRSPYPPRARRSAVSIPFIAGQWSLHPVMMCSRAAAWRVSIPFIAGQWSLPVASSSERSRDSRVSIPFIAGQWSLPPLFPPTMSATILFQSPSLRGSGRFTVTWMRIPFSLFGFNPLHCGAVVASPTQGFD